MGDFDPNMLDDREGDRRRKRRRARDMHEGEFEDAWAAADSDDIPDHHAQIEDLAAYYVYDDEERRRREGRDEDEEENIPGVPDLGPLPPSARRLADRKRQPREERLQSRYDLNQVYAGSPSYKRKRGIVSKVMEGITGSESILPPVKAKRDPNYQPGFLSTLPFWAILILVFMVFTIALISVLVCVWTMTMLG